MMVRERETGSWGMGLEVFGEVGDVDEEVNGGSGEVYFLVYQIV